MTAKPMLISESPPTEWAMLVRTVSFLRKVASHPPASAAAYLPGYLDVVMGAS